MVKSKYRENLFTKMEINIKDNLKIICVMDRAKLYILMERTILDSSKMD